MIDFLSMPLVGSAVGIIGILLAIYFFIKSQVVAKPYYFISHEEIININKFDESSKIRLFYEDSEVAYLYKTVIIFKNKGSKVINQEDIVPENFVVDFSRCNPSTFKIFHVQTNSSKKSIVTNTNIENNKLYFNFNYLDKNESIIITFIHNGKFLPENIEGEIKGVKKIKKRCSMPTQDTMSLIEYNQVLSFIVYRLIKKLF